MNKKVIISLVLVALMGFGTAIGTYAWFTSQATSNDNVFTAGTLTVDLKANGGNAENSFSIGGLLQPGDIVTKDATGRPGMAKIEIVNTGNVNLGFFDNFALTSFDKDLADKIYFKNWKNSYHVKKGDVYVQVWEDQFITNGVAKYHDREDAEGNNLPNSNNIDLNEDDKISLNEWLDASNRDQVAIANGWHVGGLLPNAKFVQEFELAFDESATSAYMGRSLTGEFKVIAGQVNKVEAVDNLMDINTIPEGTGSINVLAHMNARIQEQIKVLAE
jgi:predicted ribosomally synthesized peptide with SipW-like signal peptide